MALHHDTGKTGEAMAAQYLANHDYTILHQNWRHKHWEVDVIASKDTVFLFIHALFRVTKFFGASGFHFNKMQNGIF